MIEGAFSGQTRLKTFTLALEFLTIFFLTFYAVACGANDWVVQSLAEAN